MTHVLSQAQRFGEALPCIRLGTSSYPHEKTAVEAKVRELQSYTTLNLEKGTDVVNTADPCAEILTVSCHVVPNLRTTQSQSPDLLRSRILTKFNLPQGSLFELR